MITVNIDKATAITKDKIREYRKPLLAALDVEFNRAVEAGADTSSIISQKKELRDMPDIANGKSIDELKAIIDGLKA